MMKPLIVVMFFSVVLCAALTFPDPVATLRGLFVQAIPMGGGAYVRGIGRSLTLLS